DIRSDELRRVWQALAAMPLSEALTCADSALASDEHGRAWLLRSARLAEQAALHPDCVQELATKPASQTRCAQKRYKMAIHTLTVGGEVWEAEEMWSRATSLRAPVDAAQHRETQPDHIQWPSTLETPTVFISGLRSNAFWDCGKWPFVSGLEANVPTILAEIEEASARFETAYPYLKQMGTWQDMFLLRGHTWNTSLCSALPQTCRLLLPELPTRPGVPYATQFNEEVVIFRSEPGTSVGAHCGSSNAVVNLHLTLKGARGSSLRVAGQEVQLQDGKAVCFQDSMFHSFHHAEDGESERISLVVRVMHPDLDLKCYGSAQATDVVTDLAGWDRSAALAAEVERLRSEFRKLAAAAASLKSQVSTSSDPADPVL
ncbi:unnamed protein product, partial [Polarella glacialis]